MAHSGSAGIYPFRRSHEGLIELYLKYFDAENLHFHIVRALKILSLSSLIRTVDEIPKMSHSSAPREFVR